MNYLVVQDWPSTHGNHAGMLHMCNMLKSKYPNDYEVVVLKSPFSPFFKYITLIVLSIFAGKCCKG